MEKDMKTRIQKNAKALRFISRAQMFQKNRKNVSTQISYLKVFIQQERQLIMQSMSMAIPQELPALSYLTISLYRRANRPVFRTKVDESFAQFNPHLTYQSLFILAGIQQMNFPNYQQVIKQFQTNLEYYLKCQYPQIREMATIAAGNKIIGRQKDILNIIQMDRKQIWVMINHIYQRKMSSIHMFPYLKDHNQIIYKSLFEMSNTNDDDIVKSIMEKQGVIEILIDSLSNYNKDIQKYTIRIFGNIMAEKQDYVYTLGKYDILNNLYPFLTESDDQLRKDTCWAISNFVFERGPSTTLLHNQKVVQRLVSMIQNQSDFKIKIELCHIFSNIVAFAQKSQAFTLVQANKILQTCGQFIQIQDPQLIHVTLYLITKIVELGEQFADEDGNYFISEIKEIGLKSKIIEKTYYTDNKDISQLSSSLQQKLDQDY